MHFFARTVWLSSACRISAQACRNYWIYPLVCTNVPYKWKILSNWAGPTSTCRWLNYIKKKKCKVGTWIQGQSFDNKVWIQNASTFGHVKFLQLQMCVNWKKPNCSSLNKVHIVTQELMNCNSSTNAFNSFVTDVPGRFYVMLRFY